MKSVIYHTQSVRNAVSSYIEKDIPFHEAVIYDIDESRCVVVLEDCREFFCEIIEFEALRPDRLYGIDEFIPKYGPSTLIRVTEIFYV